ncbi:MAG: TM0996/MTH895 family glutaredoxin-like protein [Actinobacteria bacterium]|nr:TM0996/MTH895 family glutaredoxin-like protein [Actinomycetota bacterium]
MEIKVLGPGCANCKKLEANVFEAVSQLDVDADIQKIEDIQEIMSYGILSTPGLVVNGKVKVSGKVPSVAEIKAILEG